MTSPLAALNTLSDVTLAAGQAGITNSHWASYSQCSMLGTWPYKVSSSFFNISVSILAFTVGHHRVQALPDNSGII